MTRSILVLAVILAAAMLHAEDAITPKEVELYPNFETISVTVPYEGDDDENAEAQLSYRETGTQTWLPAHPLVRIKGKRFAGCVFGLKPGRGYEITVNVREMRQAPFDHDLIVLGAKTRVDAFPTASGNTIYVAPGGDDAAAGTRDAPFRTIQHAVDGANPGDVIVVTPGVYCESVRMRKSGTSEAYITLRGEPGARLTGAPERRPGGREWTKVEGDLYRANPGHSTRYVAAGGNRLYYWKTLDDLKRGNEERNGKTYSVKGGWTQAEDGTLYVRLPDGGDPENANVQITRHTEGITLDGVKHVIIEGLDLGFFGNYALVLRNTSECIVRKNVIHNTRSGMVIAGPTSHNNLIESNEFYDTSVWDWPWQMCKAHDPEGSAVVLTGGRGTVVRRNRIHGYFNAIVPSMWGRLEDERFNGDMDVHDNEMWDVGDDCLEPEGTCINQRYWKNNMRGALMGISLAPITVGPCWFVRNTVYDHHLSAVKLASDSSGPCFLYHNTFVTTVTKTDKYSTRGAVNGIGNSGAYHNMTYRNNIIMGTDYTYCDWRSKPPNGHSMDYDNLFTTSKTHFFMFGAKRYANLDEVREALGFEKHGLSVEAKFVDLGKGDLHLQADSPLIDRGVRIPNINDDFKGAGPDLGAFEAR